MEIEIYIDLENETIEQAIDLKYELAEAIEKANLGQVTGSGIGFGQIDLDVDIGPNADSVRRLRKLIELLGLAARSTLVVPETDC